MSSSVLLGDTTAATVGEADGSASPPPGSAAPRTIWGMDPVQLHARYWAARGVQVVRQGEPSQIVRAAELFLLTDPRTLTLLRLSRVVETLYWVKPQVLFVRIHDPRKRGYRERVVTDPDEPDRFLRFERIYDSSAAYGLARVVLTPEREIAQLWQAAPNPLDAWRRLRRWIPRIDRAARSVEGSVYDRSSDQEIARFVHDLVRRWGAPDATIARARRLAGGPWSVVGRSAEHRAPATDQPCWSDPTARVEAGAVLTGPVWVGAGRTVKAGEVVLGPAVLWDDPAAQPPVEDIRWLMIEPPPTTLQPLPRASTLAGRAFKRGFDLLFALVALVLSAPLWPFIMLAIWLEDGRPFFFAHRRETRGGREFPCLKFRSMRKDAEKIKAELQKLNQADGPQFYIEDDPRLTRVGRFLRKFHLDELPQFLNVMAGHMSIVGPRPSPRKENQYCPAWREARLSVRPGITGLWQVMRTRRAGADFQEWIKYDIQYVETRSWWLDLLIVIRTGMVILRRIGRA